MTPRFTILVTVSLLLSICAFTACAKPGAQPKAEEPAKTATVEATFTPENPNFPVETPVEESPAAVIQRTWWEKLEGKDGPPIQAADYTKTALLDLPFGADQATVVAANSWWKVLPGDAPPIYDPLLLDFTSIRLASPDSIDHPTADLVNYQAVATLGFYQGKFGDLRLLITEVDNAGQAAAERLIEKFGPTLIDKMQEPDHTAKLHRKTITLTWRVVDEGKRSGFISYQVVFAGPLAGGAEEFLQPGDRFLQASFTTMSPDMMTALRAANPVGSGTIP